MKYLLILSLIITSGSSFTFGNTFLENPDSVYIISKDTIKDNYGVCPVIGWEKFKSNFIYPKEAKQSSEGTCFYVYATFDKSGKSDSIHLIGTKISPCFIKIISAAIDSTLWQSPQTDIKGISFDVLFVPKAGNYPRAFIIETQGITFHGGFQEMTEYPDSAYLIPRELNELNRDHITFPKPKNGWDSLLCRLTFPKIAKRGGFPATFLATVSFDSLGTISKFTLMPEYPIYVEHVRNIFKSIQWIPAMKNGKPIEGILTIPIVFVIKNFPNLIIVESN